MAFQGATDREIPFLLEEKFGQTLCPETFNTMIHGTYSKWSKEENVRRSERLVKVLTRAREKINASVRARYLKVAMGGIRTKNKVKRFLQYPCDCDGNPDCPKCGGTGMITSTNRAIIQETEIESLPNIQALATWLYHHDAEWRKIQCNKDEEAQDVPSNIEHGIDVEKWIDAEVVSKKEK